jgi:hypothetical protein
VHYRPKGAGRSGAKRFLESGSIRVGDHGRSPQYGQGDPRSGLAGGDDPAGEQIKAPEAMTPTELAERYLDQEFTQRVEKFSSL